MKKIKIDHKNLTPQKDQLICIKDYFMSDYMIFITKGTKWQVHTNYNNYRTRYRIDTIAIVMNGINNGPVYIIPGKHIKEYFGLLK